MVHKTDFKRINNYLWEIPKEYRGDMRVPARIYADEEILDEALADQSVDQLINTATLPGLVQHTLVMPDVHQGYGFPIGGVCATRLPSGVISPGGVGYDINCGVRLLASAISVEEIRGDIAELATRLYQRVPSGTGEKGEVRLSTKELDDVLIKGVRWAKARGYASDEDIERTEERGTMPGADPQKVSAKAKERGRGQLGTLGSGNHFLEVDEVVEIYDAEAAQAMGLFQGQVVVLIHSGSRGFGHQVCTDYVKSFQSAVQRYGIKLPDRQLVCAPLDSPEGKDYLAAMACAANFAFTNRQIMAYNVRLAFEEILAGKVKKRHLWQVYDIAHNMAKIEEHEIDGQRIKVCVHRKGATRAFGPGSEVLPTVYRKIGQPVMVPGSMGTASYVLVGTEGSMAQTFGSTCHGAGRVMSRSAAKREVQGNELRAELEQQGISVRAGSMSGLAEEAPVAYKDVDQVVQIVHNAGIARKVARLVPHAVIKG
ncbi:MAG: RtcB family protein [Chloroflexi bacterium]|nr:RtcB family protein [Chloroflexota bacterium]